MVGRLEKVDLRTAWSKEAADFTTWLEKNLDLLSEQLGFDLSPLEREKAVGTFWADIVAEGPNGVTVVVENQIEKTDHDHLGKLITYLSNLEAKAAIWITSDPRPEHITAINWLNEISPDDTSFYLVKVEAYKIGESEPAPLFTAVCSPSKEAKQIGKQKEEVAERHVRRLDFWKQLLDKARQKTDLHSNVSPSKDNWVSAGAGKSGMGWSYSITMDKAWVELFMDRGPERKDETDRIFENFLSGREKIEQEFGEPLIWDKVEGRRVCYIKSFCNMGGLKDDDLWDQIQEAMIDRMVRLENALRPILSTIR